LTGRQKGDKDMTVQHFHWAYASRDELRGVAGEVTTRCGTTVAAKDIAATVRECTCQDCLGVRRTERISERIIRGKSSMVNKPSKYLNPYRAGEWRRVLLELVDDLQEVADDDDTPEHVQAGIKDMLPTLVILARKKEV
jgi:hypothetical protein